MRFVPHQNIVEAKQETPLSPTGQEGGPADELTDAQDGANKLTAPGIPKQDKSGAQEHEKRPKDVSVVLMPGSLLLFKDSAYQGDN